MLETVDRIAQSGELPDAVITASGLKITPLVSAVPEEADQTMRQAYALLPHVKIAELLSESGIFLTVRTPRDYEPGFFYVYVKPRKIDQARSYFQRLQLKADEWRREWLVEPVPKTILFHLSPLEGRRKA